MNRLGLVHPSTLSRRNTVETRALYDAFCDFLESHYDRCFTFKLPSTGALVGPFGILLYTPRIGRTILELSGALEELRGLSPRSREIANVCVAACEQSPYDLYAHVRMALQRGVTLQELQMLLTGTCPPHFNEEEKTAYGVTKELCQNTGAMSDRAWNAAQNYLGRDAIISLVQLVAYHRYLATLLRAFDAQVPPESERVERTTE